jgi:transcriptional regulator with XRE-family HTH domain
MKTYERIKQRADKIGISIAELCRRTGIHKQTLDKWSRKEPQTLEFIEKIEHELKKIENECKP